MNYVWGKVDWGGLLFADVYLLKNQYIQCCILQDFHVCEISAYFNNVNIVQVEILTRFLAFSSE